MHEDSLRGRLDWKVQELAWMGLVATQDGFARSALSDGLMQDG